MSLVEINGIKLDVDMRSAERIDTFKVGDNVKLLKGGEIYDAVIVDFVNFKELPTIEIAYFSNSYWGAEIKFEYINSATEKMEIFPCAKHELRLEKNKVVEKLQREIDSKQNDADKLRRQLEWFEKYYDKYFDESEALV